MQESTIPSVLNKIKSLEEIAVICEKKKKEGLRIVQCHGVFDLLHPGHIRHFRAAKVKGDLLVVTITQDQFVNKGPGRPAFPEKLRLEAIAALQDVDYVALNNSPDAISAIQRVKPHFYAKGIEYANHDADVTGKIRKEIDAVEEQGGSIFYTDDIVFSSSSLLNRYYQRGSDELSSFLNDFRKEYSLDHVLARINAFKDLKVLILGDAIIDEYQYVDPMGQSGKGCHLAARCLSKEVFLGGSLIIANHIAEFSNHVSLLTSVGKECPYRSFVKTTLDPKIQQQLIYAEETSTLIKKRYVLKDGTTLTKLFETYSGFERGLQKEQTATVTEYLKKEAKNYDLILAVDFGNGFTNHEIVYELSQVSTFLAVNTQTNSGNRGYNVITNYQRADYISLNEPEIRLATHNKTASLEGIAADISLLMHCPNISVTRGVNGVFCFGEKSIYIPAFATQSVDRIGAGDAYLSLSALSLASQNSLLLSGVLGSLAAAMSLQNVGNQEPIRKSSLIKYATSLMK